MKEIRYSAKTQEKQSLSNAKNVGPEIDKLKDKFKEGSIPLQIDFNQLIDIADVGRKACGQAPEQNGPGTGLTLGGDGTLNLRIGTINNEDFSPLILKEDILSVHLGSGLINKNDAISVGQGNGITVSDVGVSVKEGNGITVSDEGVSVKSGNGITVDNKGVSVKADNGITVSDEGVSVKADNGITVSDEGVSVKAGNGITVDKEGVSIDLPSGMIVMFFGDDIPIGWALCDGKSGTPDLRGRFIKASNNMKSSKGGSNKINFTPEGNVNVSSHTLTLDEIPAHNHTTTVRIDSSVWTVEHNGNGQKYQGVGIVKDNSWNDFPIAKSGGGKGHTHKAEFTGESSEITFEPPYYALAFIMKL
ncbi:tail fiber protein [Xenorhabdus sp. XENO-10]|uniref:Tail fiber protein n=1 Tax=Xenorhabdus yunnanensis TaxID=3025878 RepID=A0ABT5LJ30_9GAMM|nr:tail fiber protein [Xenorhabdus yunnanensis]MDC9591111.1 tail fiber protein [Xenorhabdus yunnanensis]